MIHICDKKYPQDNLKYKDIFNEYPFELDHFQKYAIEAIENDKHVLITAATGSGKTLPSEYAVKKYCKQGKKVIYTAPIKSLSNQKFHEFSKTYPDISFGILTGDIKFNPQADCIIMTTEILRNALFRQNEDTSSSEDNDTFNIDITDLKCVIFDEIHYINDRDRGHVWEQCIIKLPTNVQMVMLSATIDRPENFGGWICDVKGVDVWLTSTETRVVPLNHYTYFKIPDSKLKKITEKERFGDKGASAILPIVEEMNGKLIPLKMQEGKFNNDSVVNLQKFFSYAFKNNIRINNKFILNQVCDYLHINSMLPAICFVFSRRNVIEFAKSIEYPLFTGKESHIPNVIEQECKQILMKLPNYREYLNLAEYHELIALLKKGIAVHHSGILPVLREMVEMLFSKGYIKMLFATETFAIGVNMPTKTALFTGLTKFDGNGFRNLLAHEYTQMAGRSGRRGKDPVGHCIHLVNMFDIPSLQEYKDMLGGVPQTLISKFEINFPLILQQLKLEMDQLKLECDEESGNQITVTSCRDKIKDFIQQSMITSELQKEFNGIQSSVDQSLKKIESLEVRLTELSVQDEKIDGKDVYIYYKGLLTTLEYSNNKKKKRAEDEIKELQIKYPTLAKYHETQEALVVALDKLEKNQRDLESATFFVDDRIFNILDILIDNGFIDVLEDSTCVSNENEKVNDVVELTQKGLVASQIQELNSLVFSEVFLSESFNDLDVKELVAVLASFVSLRVSEDYRENTCICRSDKAYEVMRDLQWFMDKYYDIELNCTNHVDEDKYLLIYDIQEFMFDWCDTDSEEQSKVLINELLAKEIFLGELVKCILKINNIAHELESVCDSIGNVELKHKLSQIPELTLKYVATNQSLYI